MAYDVTNAHISSWFLEINSIKLTFMSSSKRVQYDCSIRSFIGAVCLYREQSGTMISAYQFHNCNTFGNRECRFYQDGTIVMDAGTRN